MCFVTYCVMLYGMCLCLRCSRVMCLNVCGFIVIYCVMVYGRLFVLISVCVRVGLMCLCDLFKNCVVVVCSWCVFVCVLNGCVFRVRCIA